MPSRCWSRCMARPRGAGHQPDVLRRPRHRGGERAILARVPAYGALDGGVSFFLPRVVRRAARAADRADGRALRHQIAVDGGGGHWTAPDDQLQAEAAKVAAQLASRGATRALGEIKRLIRRSALQSSWDEQSNAEALAMSGIGSADHLEGVTAFVEKRRAVFHRQIKGHLS
ncbi:hypothetical protein AB5I41_08530 [Sphingomonas sp. MMS24-JH45]